MAVASVLMFIIGVAALLQGRALVGVAFIAVGLGWAVLGFGWWRRRQIVLEVHPNEVVRAGAGGWSLPTDRIAGFRVVEARSLAGRGQLLLVEPTVVEPALQTRARASRGLYWGLPAHAGNDLAAPISQTDRAAVIGAIQRLGVPQH